MAIYLPPTSLGLEGQGLEGHFTKHFCQLDLQDLSDIDEAGQYLPTELACCDTEESMLVQSKLDLIIAELKQIKYILCRHKEKVSSGTSLERQTSTPASTSSRAASATSGELEMAIFRSPHSTAPSACSMEALPPPDETKPLLKH